MSKVIFLIKCFGLDSQTVTREDAEIKKAREDLGLFSGPSKAGVCWVILPGRRIEKGQYLGNQLISEQGRTWEVDVVHVEGHSAALDLTPALRAFTAQWEATAVRSQLQRGWR